MTLSLIIGSTLALAVAGVIISRRTKMAKTPPSNKGKKMPAPKAAAPAVKSAPAAPAPAKSAPVVHASKPRRAQLEIVNGQPPAGYEFCSGDFPAGTIACVDDLDLHWTGGQWTKHGKPCTAVIGHEFVGKSGTAYQDYRFVWNKDGSYAGHWLRPVKK